jgi:hypothetical protein
MPHSHSCKHCHGAFICPEDSLKCFQQYIVCRDCFWKHDFRYFLLVLVLTPIAIGLTLLLFHLSQGK